MISQKALAIYGFKTIEAYFEYIVLSKINGQHRQVELLIKAMSNDQKKHCLIWFDEQVFTEYIKYCKSKLIELM